MKNTAKKSVGVYIAIASAVLAIVGLVLYAGSPYGKSATFAIIGVSAALSILAAVIAAVKPFKALNVLAPVAAVIMAYGFVFSFASQIEPLAYVMSGLYTYDKVASFIYYVPFAAVAWLLTLIVSFTGYVKK